MINHDRTYIETTYPEVLGEWDRYVSISDGWVPLVNKLTDEIVNRINKYNEEKGTEIQMRLFQIKEKFGGLRYYSGFSDNDSTDSVFIQGIRNLIHSYENASYHICETCGMYGEVMRDSGWFYTACEEHKRGKEQD